MKVNKLIATNKRIGIYGNGIYAAYLKQRLEKWSIRIAYYVVDDEYYKAEQENTIKLSELKNMKIQY